MRRGTASYLYARWYVSHEKSRINTGVAHRRVDVLAGVACCSLRAESVCGGLCARVVVANLD